jgi:PAS domain S-box-containing protein
MVELHADWAVAMAKASNDSLIVLEPVLSRTGDDIVDFVIVYINDVGARLLRRPADRIVGQTLNQLVPPQGLGLRDSLVQAFRSNTIIRRTTEAIAAQMHSTRVQYQVIPTGGCLAVVVEDLSRERQSESDQAAVVRMLEAGMTSRLTATSILTPVFDEDGTIRDLHFVRVNERVAALLGRERIEIEGASFSSVRGEMSPEILTMVQTCWSTGEVVSVDYRTRTVAEPIDAIRLQVLKVGDVIVMHATDVSEEHRAQEELRLSEARYRAIVECAAELIVVSDRDGLMQYANPFALSVLGVDESAVVGKYMVEFTVPEDRPGIVDVYVQMRNGSRTTDRRRMRIVDGTGQVRITVGSSVALRSKSGEFDGIITIAADVTERLASEEARNELAAALAVAEQRERERLASRLHDGPVQHLAALAMLLGAEVSKPVIGHVAVRHAEGIIVDAISELRSLMFQLSPPDLQGVGLGQAIRSRAEMLFDGTNTVVAVDADDALISERSPFAASVSTALFRLAQEALVNARKHAEAGHVTVTLHDEPTGYVLDVVDDGKHADPDRLGRPQPGHLGLQMIHDRTRQMGGTVSIAAVPGHGTSVHIWLPKEPPVDIDLT